jgi:peptidoglycan/xylan/chitin deacetylase (PgdA/CDA1 family)
MELVRQTKQVIKGLLGKQKHKAVILMYHRVVDIESSPYHGIVSVDHFREQMAYLSSKTSPLSLTNLKQAVQNDEIPLRGVVITFDDGYADNFHYAYPLLEQFQLPATIFLTTGYIGSGREFWWDELERLFILPERLPDKVPLMVGSQLLSLDFARFKPEQRIFLLRGVHGILKTGSSEMREALLTGLRKVIGIPKDGRESYRAMTSDEIRQLSKGGLVEFGAHTITHPMLSVISRDEQESEIKGSIQAVEQLTGKPVSSFAYPFGASQDFNGDSIAILQSAGINIAVTTIPGSVMNDSEPIMLPRVWVGDWDSAAFQQAIEPYLQD